MGILNNKVAVITGSTRGFGLAMAKAFLAEGAKVVISSRNQGAVDLALSEIGLPSQSAGLACDVSKFNDVQALFDYALKTFGCLDIWVNNAGIAGPYGPTTGLSPASFESVVQTNILGTYHGSLIALRHFLNQKSGKLINILGHGYKGPVPFQSAYSASKIWVRSFTQCLIAENKGSGVNIFAYNPGMMATDLLTRIDVVSGYEEKLKVFPTIIRMFSKPVEVPASQVTRLASSATDGQSGRVISVDSTGNQLKGAIKELARRISGQPAPDPVQVRSLPYGEA